MDGLSFNKRFVLSLECLAENPASSSKQRKDELAQLYGTLGREAPIDLALELAKLHRINHLQSLEAQKEIDKAIGEYLAAYTQNEFIPKCDLNVKICDLALDLAKILFDRFEIIYQAHLQKYNREVVLSCFDSAIETLEKLPKIIQDTRRDHITIMGLLTQPAIAKDFTTFVLRPHKKISRLLGPTALYLTDSTVKSEPKISQSQAIYSREEVSGNANEPLPMKAKVIKTQRASFYQEIKNTAEMLKQLTLNSLFQKLGSILSSYKRPKLQRNKWLEQAQQDCNSWQKKVQELPIATKTLDEILQIETDRIMLTGLAKPFTTEGGFLKAIIQELEPTSSTLLKSDITDNPEKRFYQTLKDQKAELRAMTLANFTRKIESILQSYKNPSSARGERTWPMNAKQQLTLFKRKILHHALSTKTVNDILLTSTDLESLLNLLGRKSKTKLFIENIFNQF